MRQQRTIVRMPLDGRDAFDAGQTVVVRSRSNARVKELRASLSGLARRPGDLLGLEGPHLIREAHLAGQSFETVYIREGSEGELKASQSWSKALRTSAWVVLSRDVFDGAASTNTPQGVAATWIIRDRESCQAPAHPGLVLESLQDPGNVGTLIRSAAAFGVAEVLLTPECVNHWNPKVVRAAAGAHFRVRIRRLPLPEVGEELRKRGVRLFAAVSGFRSGTENGAPITAAPHGVLTGRVDNTDAVGPRSKDGTADTRRGVLQGYPASLCYDTDFDEPCAIMIGNEGAGLSPEARNLADEQVMIPCSVESLNAAVAGSVLMYEAMRQIPLRAWARQQGLRP